MLNKLPIEQLLAGFAASRQLNDRNGLASLASGSYTSSQHENSRVRKAKLPMSIND